MNSTLFREGAYFEAFHDQIVKGHLGEYVVIKGVEVMGYYKGMFDGGKEMIAKGHAPGTFATYECAETIPSFEIWTPGIVE